MKDTFVWSDAEGKEHTWTIVATFEYEDRKYAALHEEGSPEGEEVLFRVEEQDDDYLFEEIEDDQEFEEVLQCYEELLMETHDIVEIERDQ